MEIQFYFSTFVFRIFLNKEMLDIQKIRADFPNTFSKSKRKTISLFR